MKTKHFFLMLAMCATTFAFQSCDDDDDDKDINHGKLPQTVQQDFARRFPNTIYVEWEQEKVSKKYKADFTFYGTQEEWGVTLPGVDTHAWYTANGAWERTEYDVTYMYWNPNDTFIPAAVRTTVATQAGGREIDLDAVDTAVTDYFLLEIDWEPNDRYVKIGFDGNILP